MFEKGLFLIRGGFVFKTILGFLFGTQTNIFNKKGRVQHKFDDKKWQDWDNRLKANPDYNWRQHKGTQKQNQKPLAK